MYRRSFRSAAMAAAALMFAAPSVLAESAQSAEDNEKFTLIQMKCMSLSNEYQKMAKEMPMEIDEITLFYSASAKYNKDADECDADLQYTVDEKPFIAAIADQSGGDMTVAQAESFFATDDGVNIMKSLMKEQNEYSYKDFDMNGFNMVLTYHMIGHKLPDFEVTLFQ